MFIFLLKDYFKVGPWFKNWETKPVHSSQCRHVVACTHQIRRKRTWESLLKTIWDWESQPYQVSNMNHALSKLPTKLHLPVCQVCCCAEQELLLLQFFFSACVFWEIVAGGFYAMFATFTVLTIGSGTDKTSGLLLVFCIYFFVHQMVLKSVLFLII